MSTRGGFTYSRKYGWMPGPNTETTGVTPMTVQPDDIRYHAPGEVDDRPQVGIEWYYPDATEPNHPCTDMDEAKNIVTHHIAEYVENDTEDEELRCAALHCDLGWKFNRIAFRELADTFRPTAPNTYQNKWCEELTRWLRIHMETDPVRAYLQAMGDAPDVGMMED